MDNPLLDSYLKSLRLPAFAKHYRKFAEDAALANLTYDRFLLALAEQEIAQRAAQPAAAQHQGGAVPDD